MKFFIPIRLNRWQRLSALFAAVILLGGLVWLFIWPFIAGVVQDNYSLAQRTDSKLSEARSLVEEGNANKAIEVLENAANATNKDDEKAEYYRAQSSIIAASGDIDRAVEVMKKAESTNKLDDPVVAGELSGEAYSETLKTVLEDIRAAEARLSSGYLDQSYQRLELEISDIEKLAYLYELIGDYGTAVIYCQRAIDFYAENPDMDGFGRVDWFNKKTATLKGRS